MDDRNHQTFRHGAGLRSLAPQMGRRTYFRMARSLSQAGKGFRSDHRQRRCLGVRCPHPNPHAATRKSLKSNAIIMSQTLILQIDASLVGWILGTHRMGDIVEFADGSGVLVILPSCSSLANVSLAFLCWVTVSQLVCHKKSAYDLFWCLMACISVIAVNVTRIGFMGLSQWHYATFHSPWGDAISNTTMLGLIVGFSVLGVRRELFQRI